MAERSKCDLPYGHYGRVQFNLDDSNLEFGRLLTAPLPIRVLNTVYPRDSEPAVPQHDAGIAGPNSKRHTKQIQDLVNQQPELEPSIRLLGSLLRTSEAVQKAAGRHEPARGSLMCFVKVWSEIRHRSISLAAVATGESGSDLRLVQTQRQRRGWGPEKSVWLEVPILHGEEVTWSSDGGPILQIHALPDAASHDALLAIRLLSKTLVLRPSHRKIPLETATSNLALDLLCTVAGSETAGNGHADVSFNPWFAQQIAFVDSEGVWTVLEFQSRNLGGKSRSWNGSSGTQRSTNTFALDDGWARVFWVLNLSTLLVCTHENLAIVSLSPDGNATSVKVEVDTPGAAVCILDIIMMPESKDGFAVLTRTHVIIYHVVYQEPGNVRATVRAKMRHFKSPEDFSLRLKAWIDQDDLFLALVSSLSSQICIFHLRKAEKERLSCDSPFDLVFPEPRAIPRQLRDLHVQPLTLLTKGTALAEHQAPSQSTRFFAFMALQGDFSVLDGICYHPSAKGLISQERVVPPSWEQKLPTITQSRLRREEFVVADDVEGTERRLEPISRRARRRPAQLDVRENTVMLNLVADVLREQGGSKKSLEELADEMAAALASKDPETLGPLQSLHAMTDSDVITGDIQEASVQLQSTFGTVGNDLGAESELGDHESRLRRKLEKVYLPGFDHDEAMAGQDTTLASVYDQIVSRWITSLSAKVPGWVRLAKMNLAQSVAAQTLLAAHTLRLEEVKSHITQQSQEEWQAPEQTWELPLRASEPMSQTQPATSSTQRHISQHSALPTPSPTATPSVITASSGASISAAPELHRLSKYTMFQKPAPMVLPRPLVKVLSHWEVGRDPDDYDWLASSRHLTQQEDNEAEHDMTEKERKRMQRRAERHILRQRKEAAASQASQLTNSQATEIMSASQPVAFKTESQPSGMPASSQIAGPSNAAAASQIVPGRFGGRAPPKKRRKQGF